MLIVNDAHLCLAGRSSLEERCHYCKKPLAAYPLVMSDDAKQTVYHVTCALELATDLLVDLATFFHPPTLYQPSYVLTPPDAASAMMACGEQVPTEGDIMQSANLRQIKTAMRDQAFTGRARVSCAIGVVVAVRHSRGQLLALIRGWGGRWYPVDSVYIAYADRTLLS